MATKIKVDSQWETVSPDLEPTQINALNSGITASKVNDITKVEALSSVTEEQEENVEEIRYIKINDTIYDLNNEDVPAVTITGGTGINVSDENVISIDDTVTTKSELDGYLNKNATSPQNVTTKVNFSNDNGLDVTKLNIENESLTKDGLTVLNKISQKDFPDYPGESEESKTYNLQYNSNETESYLTWSLVEGSSNQSIVATVTGEQLEDLTQFVPAQLYFCTTTTEHFAANSLYLGLSENSIAPLTQGTAYTIGTTPEPEYAVPNIVSFNLYDSDGKIITSSAPVETGTIISKFSHRETNIDNISGNLNLEIFGFIRMNDISPSSSLTEVSITGSEYRATLTATFALSGVNTKGNVFKSSVKTIRVKDYSYLGTCEENDSIPTTYNSSMSISDDGSFKDITHSFDKIIYILTPTIRKGKMQILYGNEWFDMGIEGEGTVISFTQKNGYTRSFYCYKTYVNTRETATYEGIRVVSIR